MKKSKKRNAHHGITPAELEASYRACLERERKREYAHRQTRQGAFEHAFIRSDGVSKAQAAPVELRSSHTLGTVIASAGRPVLERVPNKLKYACEKLRRHGLGYLVRTLQLIAKNVNNRDETIWQMILDAREQRSANTVRRQGTTNATATPSATFLRSGKAT